jgi:hypothetical protein
MRSGIILMWLLFSVSICTAQDNSGGGNTGISGASAEEQAGRDAARQLGQITPLVPLAPSTQPAASNGKIPDNILAFLDSAEVSRISQISTLKKQLSNDLKSAHAGQQTDDSRAEWRKRLVADRQAITDMERSKGKYVPLIGAIGSGDIGMFGWRAQSNLQVVDDSNLLISWGHGDNVAWIRGFQTAGHVNGEHVSIPTPVIVNGTTQYNTASGSTNTGFVIEPINLAPYQAVWLDQKASKASPVRPKAATQ